MEKKKIIVVCGSLYRRKKTEPCSCGSDLVLEEELENMMPFCQRIDVVSLFRNDLPEEEKINKVIIVHRRKIGEIEETIEKLNIINRKTDFIITQLLLCDIGLKKGVELSVPTIYYVMSLGSKIDISKKGKYSPSKIVSCSNFVGEWIKREWGRNDVTTSYPTFNGIRKRLKAKKKELKRIDKKERDFDFLMVNPNKVKGGEFFFGLAKIFPQFKFGAVMGWENLKNKNKKFDPYLMELMSRAHGEKKVYIPEEPVPPKIPNLKILKPFKNIEDILIKTNVVLFPSQWEEAFGRVIVEAGLVGRVVIASYRGGIPEAMEIAGMPKKYMKNLLVKNYSDISSWERAICWYLNNKDKIPKPVPKIPKSKVEEILSMNNGGNKVS